MKPAPTRRESRSRTPASAAALLAGVLAVGLAVPAAAFDFALHRGVKQKAVVVTHDAKLYRSASGRSGAPARFMSLYYLLEPAEGGRVPVASQDGSPTVVGWLDRSAYVAWNTRAMIDFAPRGHRKPLEVFSSASCAARFAATGATPSGCAALGREPRRRGSADAYRLLIPVYESARHAGVEVVQGGFVRVREGASRRRGAPSEDVLTGMDVLFVVDATGSMGQWFQPTTAVLQALSKHIRASAAKLDRRLRERIRFGLLLYRDRQPEKKSYLTHWAARLGPDVDRVGEALERAESDKGGDRPEAIYDALKEGITGARWEENAFRVIVLIGDSPAHEPGSPGNPLNIGVDEIEREAAERKIRIIAVKVRTDTAESELLDRQFRALAQGSGPATEGRFAEVEQIADPKRYEQALLGVLKKEWLLVTKAYRTYFGDGIAAGKPSFVSDYEWPIIVANTPEGADGSLPASAHVKAWVPTRVDRRPAVTKYYFMRQARLALLLTVLEGIAAHYELAPGAGGDAFLSAIRTLLASVFAEDPGNMFRPQQTLADVLSLQELLPVRSHLLNFTPSEVQSFTASDFDRIIGRIREAANAIRSHVQDPTKLVVFGSVKYHFVPASLFP